MYLPCRGLSSAQPIGWGLVELDVLITKILSQVAWRGLEIPSSSYAPVIPRKPTHLLEKFVVVRHVYHVPRLTGGDASRLGSEAETLHVLGNRK
jgi:hypothetical protein